jgi:NAD(P)-dependent dehydrogenase (short-subunit alcohol dehydrogenase family)
MAHFRLTNSPRIGRLLDRTPSLLPAERTQKARKHVAYPGIAGKVAIVTGAAGGIGKALVDAFVKEGLRVAALDIEEKGVRALQEKYGDAKVLGLRVDVADSEDCRRQVSTVVERLGTVHILINNAALGMNSVADDYDDEHLQIEDVPDDLWRRFFAVNVGGAFSMTRAVVPIFRKQKWGRVINVSTSMITMMRKGFVPYGPTKAALEAWSQILSRQLEGSGITVNVVLPGGPVDTIMVPGDDRSALISPSVMSPPMLALFTEAGRTVTGQRFIAVEWDESLGTDPAAQPHAPAAWPQLAKPFSKMRQRV